MTADAVSTAKSAYGTAGRAVALTLNKSQTELPLRNGREFFYPAEK